MLRALIVEDEDGSRDRLRRLLRKHASDVEVVGEADSGPRALELIGSTTPDLVFLDVSLPGFDGFALLDQIESDVRVIFTTASHEHAVRAFDAGAAHYLLKPIDPDQLQEALLRVRKIDPRPRLEPSRPGVSRLLCRDRDTTHVVRPEEILFMKADQGYTLVRTAASEYLSDESLGTLEAQFGQSFVRIHRNALVNIDHVGSLRHIDNETIVVLRDGIQLPVSRRHAQGLRERLLYGTA
jgi:DNA-binding LytR/AlgR family response regulator